ncbi:uncharacterized protein LOC127279167 [Leptopilina boulardi]|uniref:uncharacterized protein LOC127279167 n=1 Tax=Leptopilina boulardi TaxID=63433 RepID=UPI0021F50E9E|nr:uncharacterized protein LOC127279167 [Leptopilina boulardi]
MSDQRKSILDKLYECVNNGVDWGINYTKHPCPPKKKSMKKGSDTFEDDLRRKKNRELENNDKSGKDQDSQGTIRDYRDFQEKSQDDSDFEKRKDTKPPAEEPPCCDIPMQDPSSPCYETQDLHCQCKKVNSNEPREPTSACDCSQHDRRYTGKETLFGEDIRLERA